MFENSRTKKLVILGAVAVVLGLFAVAPAFAWDSTLTSSPAGTTVYCYTSGAWSACSNPAAIPGGTSVKDNATLGLDGYSCSGSNCGTISFYVISGAAPGTCPSSPLGSYPSPISSSTVPSSAPGTKEGTYHYTWYTSSSTSPAAGSYFFYVYYNAGSSGYPSRSACEPFTLLPLSIPTPEFPFGMLLLLAVAIPGLLLVRSKFTSKYSPSPA